MALGARVRGNMIEVVQTAAVTFPATLALVSCQFLVNVFHVLSQPAPAGEGALAVWAREATSPVQGSNVIPQIDLRREQHPTITALGLRELRVIQRSLGTAEDCVIGSGRNSSRHTSGG